MKKITCAFIVLVFAGLAAAVAETGLLEKTEILVKAEKYAECFKLLDQALRAAASPAEKAEIYWYFSRVTYFFAEAGKKAKMSKELLLREHEKGIAYAGDAIKSDPRSYWAFFWRASHLGSWAQANGSLEAVGKIAQAREDLNAAIRLKPDFHSAYYVLGMFYGGAPGWPISFGNREYGISLLRKAIDLAGKPAEAGNYYLSLADNLWQRNWDSATRNNRRRVMRDEFLKRDDPADKNCFFEGTLDFSIRPYSGAASLGAMSDREEADAIMSFLEKEVMAAMTSDEDAEKMRKGIEKTSKKFR